MKILKCFGNLCTIIKSKKKGSFTSQINSKNLPINATNRILEEEISKFENTMYCKDALDGSSYGYVYSIENKEIFGYNSFATVECLKDNESIIAKDLWKIINLNYTIKPL